MNASGTILLVDDEKEFIDAVAVMLTGEGYTPVKADSGQSAFEAYVRCQPDLVLLDVMMPGIDGFETCRQLKARYGDDCAPVIFFTAKTETKDIAEGFRAGGADYLAKPCRMNEVRARIRSHVQNRLFSRQQRQMVDQMLRANHAKNRFIGMAAHDMRNPLVTIRGMADMLFDGTVGEMRTQQLALISIIRATSQSMLDTLNKLLDVATIEAGEFNLNLSSHDLAALVAKSVAMSKREAAKKRTRIELIPAGAGPALTLDADKIKQVVDNLLSNAIKYSPPGSTIAVTVHPIEDGAGGFAVRDQGPGMGNAERHKIFKSTGPLSTQPALDEKSTGVGLVICRRIVEAHGGTITVENLPDCGCELRVTLPLDATKRSLPTL